MMNYDDNETMDDSSYDGGIYIFFKRTEQAAYGLIRVAFQTKNTARISGSGVVM
jgi:hypothetical protein